MIHSNGFKHWHHFNNTAAKQQQLDGL